MGITALIASLNINFIIAIVTVCLTAMATLIAIYRRRIKPDELPGKSVHCAQQNKEIERIEKANEDVRLKNENLKESVNKIQTEIAAIQEQNKYACKSLDEMKQDNKAIVQRLDDLLKQLMDFLNH